MIEIIIIGLLILAALWGAHKGLLESIGGVARIVVSFLGASWAANILTDPLTEMIRPTVEKHIGESLTAIDMSNIEEKLKEIFFTKDSIQETMNDIIANVTNKGMTVATATIETISHNVTYVVVYVLAFVIIMIALWLVMKPLQLMTRLPGLHLLNSLGGGAVGVIWGALLVFLAVWVMVHFDIYLTPNMVENSAILQFFVYNSPLKLITSL